MVKLPESRPNAQSACTKTPQDQPTTCIRAAKPQPQKQQQSSARSKRHVIPISKSPRKANHSTKKSFKCASPQANKQVRITPQQCYREDTVAGQRMGKPRGARPPWAKKRSTKKRARGLGSVVKLIRTDLLACQRLVIKGKVVWKGRAYTTLDLSQKAKRSWRKGKGGGGRGLRGFYTAGSRGWRSVPAGASVRDALATALTALGDFFAPALAGWLEEGEVPSTPGGKMWVVDSVRGAFVRPLLLQFSRLSAHCQITSSDTG
ncbi:hypothetical protein IWX90DRAFT_495388 [Phyllosticta citrichinensis]|uniref:Uncharacterized protein n=1 Tax=Phyllosticta citrichinensis TaxID=1130410 RepID=A0ABR1XGP2_9PEZI